MSFEQERRNIEDSFDVAPFLYLNINDEKYDMKIAGDFNAYNALAAYTVLRELGLNEQTSKNGLKRIHQTMVVCSTLKKNERER